MHRILIIKNLQTFVNQAGLLLDMNVDRYQPLSTIININQLQPSIPIIHQHHWPPNYHYRTSFISGPYQWSINHPHHPLPIIKTMPSRDFWPGLGWRYGQRPGMMNPWKSHRFTNLIQAGSPPCWVSLDESRLSTRAGWAANQLDGSQPKSTNGSFSK